MTSVLKIARALSRRVAAARQAWSQLAWRAGGVTIGAGCHIAPGSEIAPRTSIGDGTRINGPAVIKGAGAVSIGRYCAIGDGVRLISANHRLTHANLQGELQAKLGLDRGAVAAGPVAIGDGVWIGDAAIVLAGVSIGNGAVIG